MALGVIAVASRCSQARRVRPVDGFGTSTASSLSRTPGVSSGVIRRNVSVWPSRGRLRPRAPDASRQGGRSSHSQPMCSSVRGRSCSRARSSSHDSSASKSAGRASRKPTYAWIPGHIRYFCGHYYWDPVEARPWTTERNERTGENSSHSGVSRMPTPATSGAPRGPIRCACSYSGTGLRNWSSSSNLSLPV